MLIIIYILYILRNISNVVHCFPATLLISTLSAPYQVPIGVRGIWEATKRVIHQIGCKGSAFF